MNFAVVTGGTSGIGLGVSKMLLDKGYFVISTYVGDAGSFSHERFLPIQTDQCNRDEVYKFIEIVK